MSEILDERKYYANEKDTVNRYDHLQALRLVKLGYGSVEGVLSLEKTIREKQED